MPDARDCAQLLLETIPSLMHGMKAVLRPPRIADEEALTMGQFRMLDMLRCAPFSLSELASRHNVTPSTMSRAIDLLVRKNWVARRSDPGDRRQVILTLTDVGQSAHDAMQQHAQDALTNLLAQLGDDERARVFDGLTILRALLDRSAADAAPDQ